MATAASAVVLTEGYPNFVHINFLPTVSATDDGDWVETGGYADGSIDVVIATTATVQVRGSDGDATGLKPASTAHGNQIGSDITASGMYDLARAPRWIKVRVTAWTAGTVNVKGTLRRAVR